MDSEPSLEPMNMMKTEMNLLNNTNVLPTLHCSTFKAKTVRSVRTLQEQIKENILTNRFNRRKENLEQITHANMSLFKRINSQKSAYSLKTVEAARESQQSTQQSRATTISNFRAKSSSARFLRGTPDIFRGTPDIFRGTPDIFRDRQFQSSTPLPLHQLRVYTNVASQDGQRDLKQIAVDGPKQIAVDGPKQIAVDGPKQQSVTTMLRAKTRGKQNEGARVRRTNLLSRIEDQLSKSVQRMRGNLIHIF